MIPDGAGLLGFSLRVVRSLKREKDCEDRPLFYSKRYSLARNERAFSFVVVNG